MPKMPPVIADTSAIIAYLNFEPGADEVMKYLARIRLTMVNLAEIVAVVSRHNVSRSWVEERILRVFSELVPFDREQAYLCGALEAITRPKGLSLGDRACLAAGILHGWPVLTCESRWKEIDWKAHGYDLKIHLIRERKP
ncbi:MAG TPA: type II toxin-antitoxin system VapC family toxin [Gemmataceae bacterium]|nr:type II toxin-antitoxin system VapC family toxin [Gemmataceae bacterium]